MKRLLLLVAALFMVAGVASAQTCLELSQDGDEVSMVLFIDEVQVDIWHIAFWDWYDTTGPYFFDFDTVPEGEPRVVDLASATDDLLTSGDWHIEYAPSWAGWYAYEDADPPYEGTFGDGVAAGGVGDGDCEFGGAAEPEVSASITGPHNVDPGDAVVLEVVTEGLDEGTETYLWDDDSTAATRDLGVVDGGDTGVYTCEVSGDVDGEALEEPLEASFTLWVGVATPLAGGLGLGLLAGACALAGAVSIRRKK